jgi:hypothetical protein
MLCERRRNYYEFRYGLRVTGGILMNSATGGYRAGGGVPLVFVLRA